MHYQCIFKTQPSWIAALATLATATPAIAQIVPDTSLPNNSTVVRDGNRFTIDGGTTAGSNLFHSFSEFSVPTGAEAFFNNVITIDNIITRVTGGNISNINGLVRANSTANLFLLNPNGIIFGPNARLDIGGSFIGSTADRINFTDGNSFSATEANTPPLLTVNLPVGLQWGSNTGAIVNRSRVTNGNGEIVGLQVEPGKTLALMGGEVTVEGGYLSAPEGQVELAGISDNSRVNYTATDNRLVLGYEDVESFRNVQFSQGASVDVSGSPSGSVQVQAQRFQLSDRSHITSINSSSEPGGGITIATSEAIELRGTGNPVEDLVRLIDNGIADNSSLPSGLFTSTVGRGGGGDIALETRQLTATDGAFIYGITESSGPGGDLTINSSESIQLSASSLRAEVFSQATGAGGNLTINTSRLFLQEGADIATVVQGAGSGGNLIINSSESIELVGTNFIVVERSDGTPFITNTALAAATESGSSGDAGEMQVLTRKLIVSDGASLVVNSVGEGKPGNLFLTATESAEFIGISPGDFVTSPSSILAVAVAQSATETSGADVTIITGNLILQDEATILLNNVSPGNGGNIEVMAESIELVNGASIEADTAFGKGGNIVLLTQNLQLRDNSQLTVTAGSPANPLGLPPDVAELFAPLVTGVGDGGNITIETDTLVALENSDITANAVEGSGGRVRIAAEAIFGTQFQERLTPQSDITATSERGAEFSGIVEIRTPEIDTSSALVDLPENVIDPTQQIAPGCIADEGNSYIITGRGGLPPNPTVLLRGKTLWSDERLTSLHNTKSQPPLREATGWITHVNGQVELISQQQVNDNIRASTLNAEGRILLRRGKTQAALETWQKAARSYQLAADELGVLGATINQAQALQSLGLYRQARKLLEPVNQSLEMQPDTSIKATALRSLGVTLQALGELETSREILQRSLAISQRLGLDSLASGTLLNLGNGASAQLDSENAIAFYQQAATKATTSLEKTEALLNLLAVYVQEARRDEARRLLPQIEKEILELPISRDGIYARVNLASSLIEMSSDVGSAANLLSVAVEQARELADQRGEAIALETLGLLYQKTGQLATAKQLTEKSVLIAEGIKADDIVARSQSQLGNILKQQGEFEQAIIAYSNAVKGFESLRKDLVAISKDVRLDFRQTIEPTYRALVSLLLRDNPSQAQREKAVKLIEGLQLAELENFFRDTCLEPEPEQIDQIESKAAVIYPIVLPDSLDILLLQQGRPILHHKLKISQQEVEDAILQMRRSVRIPFDVNQFSASAKLYDWLIEPFEEQLASNQTETLVFVLDGNLRNLPIAALYDRVQEEYLVEKYALALTPGLQLLKSPSIQPEKLQVLTAGISESVLDFSPLPAVEWELEKIAQLIPSQGLLNQEFTGEKLAAKTEENPFTIIHLATHGQFSSNPDETFILAWDKKIKVTEFEQLLRQRDRVEPTPIELLVLSACQTATGDDRAALGLAGVAVRSGARSTLATLWSVQDGSTAQLIVEFYQQLTNPNISKAEALRRAQVRMLNSRYNLPYFWAPFVLVGNWQ